MNPLVGDDSAAPHSDGNVSTDTGQTLSHHWASQRVVEFDRLASSAVVSKDPVRNGTESLEFSWWWYYTDPLAEAEYVAYLNENRTFPILITAAFLAATNIIAFAFAAPIQRGMGDFLLIGIADVIWIADVVALLLLRHQLARLSSSASDAQTPTAGDETDKGNFTSFDGTMLAGSMSGKSSARPQSPSGVEGVVRELLQNDTSIFSPSDAREAIRRNAALAEWVMLSVFAGAASTELWLYWAKKDCYGLEGQEKFDLCTNAINWDGAIVLFIPISSFMFTLRFWKYFVAVLFSLSVFFGLRHLPSSVMPDIYWPAYWSSLLLVVTDCCVALAGTYHLDKMRRGEFECMVQLHFAAIHSSSLREGMRKKRVASAIPDSLPNRDALVNPKRAFWRCPDSVVVTFRLKHFARFAMWHHPAAICDLVVVLSQCLEGECKLLSRHHALLSDPSFGDVFTVALGTFEGPVCSSDHDKGTLTTLGRGGQPVDFGLLTVVLDFISRCTTRVDDHLDALVLKLMSELEHEPFDENSLPCLVCGVACGECNVMLSHLHGGVLLMGPSVDAARSCCDVVAGGDEFGDVRVAASESVLCCALNDDERHVDAPTLRQLAWTRASKRTDAPHLASVPSLLQREVSQLVVHCPSVLLASVSASVSTELSPQRTPAPSPAASLRVGTEFSLKLEHNTASLNLKYVEDRVHITTRFYFVTAFTDEASEAEFVAEVTSPEQNAVRCYLHTTGSALLSVVMLSISAGLYGLARSTPSFFDAHNVVMWTAVGLASCALQWALTLTHRNRTFVQRLALELLMVVHTVSYCVSVVVAPRGNVIGNGIPGWMYAIAVVSLSRPEWRGPLAMWAMDLGIFACFFVAASFESEASKKVYGDTADMFLAAASGVAFLLFRLQRATTRRLQFARQLRVAFLDEELENNFEELETVLNGIAPRGLASQMVRQAKRSVDINKKLAIVGFPRSFQTATDDMELLTVEVRCDKHSGASHRGAYEHLLGILNEVIRDGTGQRFDVTRVTSTVAVIAARKSSRNDLEERCGVLLQAALLILACPAVRCGRVDVRMLLTCGPTIGAAVGEDSVSFDCYGAHVAAARELLPLVAFGCVVASTRFAVKAVTGVDDSQLPRLSECHARGESFHLYLHSNTTESSTLQSSVSIGPSEQWRTRGSPPHNVCTLCFHL